MIANDYSQAEAELRVFSAVMYEKEKKLDFCIFKKKILTDTEFNMSGVMHRNLQTINKPATINVNLMDTLRNYVGDKY